MLRILWGMQSITHLIVHGLQMHVLNIHLHTFRKKVIQKTIFGGITSYHSNCE